MRTKQKPQDEKKVERVTRQDWLVHFRLAVTHDTLDHMANRLWESITDDRIRLEMWIAYGDRQDEIDNNVFVNRVKFPKFY